MKKVVIPGTELFRAYFVQKRSLREIALESGHDLKTVMKLFKENGIRPRGLLEAWRVRKERKIARTREWLQEQYHAENRSLKSIAGEIGINRHTLSKHLKNIGIGIKNKKEAVSGRKKSEKHRKHISQGRKIMLKSSPELIRKLRMHRLKQVLPVKDTLPERVLEDELARREIGHYKHLAVLGICQPDKAFPDRKIAVFCDGDYWHARDDVRKKDERVNRKLKNAGWTVLRFWEHEIKKNPKEVVDEIEKMLKKEVYVDGCSAQKVE
ncbi:MAG: DUF559 domain-containing protein [Candidatus Micrarchaeota archaeon]